MHGTGSAARVLLHGMRARVFATAVSVMAVAGCSSSFNADQYPTPDEKYQASIDFYNRGKCHQAVEGFRLLTFELDALDPRMVDVRYYMAECTLDQGQGLEAARLFRRVSDEFPRHPRAPQALLRAGDSYASLWKKPQLDPVYGETAQATYRELLSRYPASEAADSANQRIAALNEWFARKGYDSGNFYYRLRAYDSAILYFKDVIAQYPQSTWAPKAVVRLIEAYTKIGYDEEKREMCDYLQLYYPDAEKARSVCPEQFASS